MAGHKVVFSSGIGPRDPADQPLLVIGLHKYLTAVDFNLVKPKFGGKVAKDVWTEGLSKLSSSSANTVSLYLNSIYVATLPAEISRHNTPSRAHSLAETIKNIKPTVRNVLIVCERDDVYASGCAVGRCYPLYSRKTNTKEAVGGEVKVEFLVFQKGSVHVLDLSNSEVELLQDSCSGIQLAARIVDTPTNEMHTDAFLEEVRTVEKELAEFGVTSTVIRGEELREKGFGGIYGVGKASDHPPALAVLKYEPTDAQRSIAWVGKGIVYDTGGLCIKSKTGMTGMKGDCGGAAAVLGAFYTAVRAGFKDKLYAVLCIAENSISSNATRPDDVHTLYSGKTVEINNTDAEGRLVLADGVVYAARDLKAEIILDICTLTGAQGVATGKKHAGHLANKQEWEEKLSKAGRNSGDLSFPIVFCPEFHFPEFKSSVADMKNSVADRCNATSSCAGIFILAHLGFDFQGAWLHVDMAYPSTVGERATGYGVSLLNCLFGDSSKSEMLQSLAPQSINANGNDSSRTNSSKKMRLD